MTEQTGRVVCEGTRRYRLCGACIQESGLLADATDTNGEEPGLLLGVEEDMEENRDMSWGMDEDDLAEDSGTDLIIQEVEDSEEDTAAK